MASLDILSNNRSLPAPSILTQAQLLERLHRRKLFKSQPEMSNLQRVQPGRYVAAEEWQRVDKIAQHRMEIHAAYTRLRSPDHVVSHGSAAILHGLSLYRPPTLVHFSGESLTGNKRSHYWQKHNRPVDSSDLELREGLRCTSLRRTLLDVARFGRLEDAVICLDAAFRLVDQLADETNYTGNDFFSYDAVPLASPRLRQDLLTRLACHPGGRGVKQARFAIGFASTLSESPLESLSRLRIHQCGLPAPKLQVPIKGQRGTTSRLDFLLEEFAIFGECDGRIKYQGSAEMIKDVLYEEKQREDWIRAQTGWRCVRWGWSDVRHLPTFMKLLQNAGIPSSAFRAPKPPTNPAKASFWYQKPPKSGRFWY